MPRDHEQNLTPQQRLARLAGLIPRGSSTAARTPFVVLVVLLLGSGMLGLLLLNAALNEGSFELSELRKETQELMDEEQELRAEVDAYADPEALAERARELGMVPAGPPAFLGEDGVIGIRRQQRLDDRGFRRVVDLAHEVLRPLGRDREKLEIARAAIDDVAGASCGLHGRREHRMHDEHSTRAG